ncbi:FAD binding domain-containing protein [Hypoxylon argillaceum]|nr:FAD binding domain-containing protein [Hypoxylon argillaceum]
MSATPKHDLDVLIVGGGPAGTMLALELAAQGLAFRIIDKAHERSDRSRALIIQPRSFEMMNRHGEARKLYEKGNLTGGPMAWMNNKPIVDIDVRQVANHRDSEFGLPCLLSQADTEAYLDECLKERYGHEIERGLEATSIVQDEEGVDVTIRSVYEGVEKRIRTKYIIGADGARSAVRKSSRNIKFEGAQYPHEFIMCDATIENFTLPIDRYHLILGNGLFAIFPMAEGWARIMISRNPKFTNATPTLDEIKAAVYNRIPGGGEITNATWVTSFRLHHRIVDSYRDARLLLIGDAAHIHSPVGGQGLNTSMQDAVNLGWKLGRVVRGERPDSFLDTLDAERRPIGQELIAKTDKTFNLLSMTNPLTVYLRNWALPWLAPWVASKGKLEAIYAFISQFGVSYRESRIVHGETGYSGPVMAGDRAPDGDVDVGGEARRLHKLLVPASHNLVLFSGSLRTGTELEEMKRAAARFGRNNVDKARVHMVVQERGGEHAYSHRLHGTYGFAHPSFAYIRPDGYVASIGTLGHFDEFLSWLN